MRYARLFGPTGRLLRSGLLLLVGLASLGTTTAAGKACVWKVTDGAGHMLYLAGSVHELRAVDYPLPPEYEAALDASAGVSFETDANASPERWAVAMQHASTLPAGVTLKDEVDPRTYAYMRKLVVKFHGSADLLARLDHLKPWYIAEMLNPPSGEPTGVSMRYGVEAYLAPRAKKAHKKLDGLETFDDHIAVMGNMSQGDNETKLLLAFIQLDQTRTAFNELVAAWKRGDIVTIGHLLDEEYRAAPSLHRRMLTDRNLNWMPKLEGYLRSGRTWMVVAGAGHMAGDQGVPALLRARGFQVEQL